MHAQETTPMIDAYRAFLANKDFPCIAARAALANQHIKCMVAENMACPKDDMAILNFLYDFISDYRNCTDTFYSAAIIFKGPQIANEEEFDTLLWQRLQSLSDIDAKKHNYDGRVSADPASANFSFSIMEEAFFIIGLHPASSRLSRRFGYPALAFNPHAEFEKLRAAKKYGPMKEVVRKRDVHYSGSVNPMLNDFGETSEVKQYSGKNYKQDWQCPLIIQHANSKHNSTP